MVGRLRMLGVVLMVVLVLVAVSHAYASEYSVATWWDHVQTDLNGHPTGGYGDGSGSLGTYGTFDNAWQYTAGELWHDGNTYHELAVELAGYRNQNAFGWFDVSQDYTDYPVYHSGPNSFTYPGSGYHQIFSGPNSPLLTATAAIPAGTLFDFWMATPDNNTFHSANVLKSTTDAYSHHAWVFESLNSTWKNLYASQGYTKAYMICWEDLPWGATWDPSTTNPKGWHTNGEPDNNDMVVFFWTKEHVQHHEYPEPGSMALLSMALCGAIGVARKRRLI